MRRPVFAGLLPLLALMASLCPASRADTPAPQLQVHTATGQSTFHLGERIPLTLAFSASADAHLHLTMATYDRSGRMPSETFTVNPSSGAKDPLAAYFASGSFMGGGLSSPPRLLTPEPVTVPLDLNEWLRFDQPGDYTVTVESTRILRPNSPPDVQARSVRSNPLVLHIVAATPAWQAATLAAAQQVLGAKRQPFEPPSPELHAAIAQIRFLNSPASIALMAAGLDDGSDTASTFALGLIGVPPALGYVAVRTLRQRLEDPQVAASSWLLTALTALEAAPSTTPEQAIAARKDASTRVLQQALRALPLKSAQPRALTADLLLRNFGGQLTPAQTSEVAQALGPVFAQLSADRQTTLMQYQWAAVRPLLDAHDLERLAALPLVVDGNAAPQDRLGLVTIALRRLYELNPARATQLAYAQLDTESLQLTADYLSFLPDKPLSALEPRWAQTLLLGKGDAELLASLMARFGTGQFASQVAARLRLPLGNEGCRAEAAMLAYVLRFDPDQGSDLVRAAIEQRSGTGCYRNLLQEVARHTASPALLPIALDQVNDPDPQTAIDAIEYLKVYGDTRGRPVLLARYRTWAAEWAGRPEELVGQAPFTASPNWDQARLGQTLATALLVNQGWIPDDALRSEVLALCVGKWMCSQLQSEAGRLKPPFYVAVLGEAGESWVQFGPYSIPSADLLRRKLSQSPEGTTFFVSPGEMKDPAFAKQLLPFTAAGMKLVLDTPVR